MARQCGLPFLSSTGGTGAATTMTDTTVLVRAVDDELVGMSCYIAAADLPHRIITDNVQSTGVVTYTPNSATNVNGTYEILAFPADAIHSALNEALMMLYDKGALVRKHWIHAVSGSPIYNADMSYWTARTTDAATLHGWTLTGATLNDSQAAADKWIGENVAQLSAANGNLRLDLTWARFLADMAGSSVRIHAWMNGTSAGANRAALLEDATSVANTGNHSGDSDWHLVSSSFVTLTQGETDIRVQFERAAGTSACSLIWLEGGSFPDLHPIPIALFPDGPTEIYQAPLNLDTTNARTQVIPSNAKPLSGWDFMRYHDEAADVEMGVLRWIKRPPAGRMLWIAGSGPFTLPTADTGVVEVNQTEGLLVAKLAAIILMERSMHVGSPAWAQRISRLARDVDQLMGGLGAGTADYAPLGPTW